MVALENTGVESDMIHVIRLLGRPSELLFHAFLTLESKETLTAQWIGNPQQGVQDSSTGRLGR